MPGLGLGLGLNLSKVTIIVPPANNPATAAIVGGSPVVGSTLIGQWADPDGILEEFGFEYQQSDDGLTGWTPIPNSYSQNYTIVSNLVGKYVRFWVALADGNGNYEEAVSAPVGPVTAA